MDTIHGVYANLNWYKKYIDINKLPKNSFIWLAQYNNTITADFNVDIWQYSSKYKIDGIEGNVDINKTINYENKINDIKTESSLYTYAINTIAGLYGNGEERKQKLENIYNVVQNLVNKILYNTRMLKNEIAAREVIRGLYGNGEERKQKLTKARL